jgi:putative membrane-bound dehydrogenase-like protein
MMKRTTVILATLTIGLPWAAAEREPANAIAGLSIHEELEAQLFASEPMMLSPSAIDVDHKGRVWVCEVINYRGHRGKRPEGDRILILEDSDGDAKADKSTVFYQGLDVDSAHGICVLGDRVIISAGDDVFSLYDRDGDGKADAGSKELIFTKIGGAQHDHGIHALHFGPDGRLYFNFGNAGKKLHDKDGKIIVDKAGNEVRGDNLPYQQGMVFRCELDGSGVETLGWNFRNNWEIAVDSFGTVWQSDNDDDGNKGVRINYVMEFGNYGYKDEITRAGWRDPRPNIEKEIPHRHWHLNDPGVVPNLIQTGAGSPTGICLYEGDLLPKVFHGQPIHCDAGPNIVRAYLTKPDGAGYSAEILNILEGSVDRWFRPSDVCVAPDGSLIVADWYDPGVGGHGMRDLERGRVFRVAPKAAAKYGRLITDVSSIEGAIIALQSPNEEARFLAWRKLQKEGKKAEAALGKLFGDKTALPQHRARALWLLARTKPDTAFAALKDSDPNIRITALRALRQLQAPDILTAAERLVSDPDPRVRREVAIAIRHSDATKANEIWGQLAGQHTPGDRWGLEALGIAADLHWDARLAAAKNPHAEIIWRSRASSSAELITKLLLASKGDAAAKYFRALQFQKDKAAANKAFAVVFQKGDQEPALLAASQLGSSAIGALPGGNERLTQLIAPVRGKAEFVELVARLNLRGFSEELLQFIIANPDANESVTAARLILRDVQPLHKILRGGDQTKVSAVTTALGKTGDRNAMRLLAGELKRKDCSAATRRAITNALVVSGQGGRELLELVKRKELPDDLKAIAALGLARSADKRVRDEAAKLLPVPKAEGFPPIAELAQLKGNAKRGESAYSKAGCIACHRVKGQHIDFGPDLSEIGKKLSKEAMYQSILFPNAAISHGFHGVTLSGKNGTSVAGYITSETDESITIRLPGGVSQKISSKDITGREDMQQSLMPPGLAASLKKEELADLVAYLQSLK